MPGPGPIPVAGLPDGVVLYDGVCVLCSGWFRFVATRDPAIRFRFVAIQAPAGRRLAQRLGIDPDAPSTNAVIIDGQAWLRSDSALQILRRLPGWSWTGLLLAVPRPIRDRLYGLIARNRYRWFGRAGTCLVPDAALLRHMLPETAALG